MDAISGEIAAHVLTDGHADDTGHLPDLLRQPEGDIASLIRTVPTMATPSTGPLLPAGLDDLRM